MNWQAISFDWNQVRAFLATAEEGSLSAAARVLGQTQPTLSRQVAALEANLGVTLFERAGRAVALTDAGREVLGHVRAMGEAATKFSLTALGQSQAIEGRVVITATHSLAIYQLPPIIRRISDLAPDIEIEIITSSHVQDLTKREADISIRHARPEQPDLIAKLIGETKAHLYGSQDFIQAHGPFPSLEAVSRANFIGVGQNERMIEMLRPHGLNLSPGNIKIGSFNGTVIRELVAQGLGLSVVTRDFEMTHRNIRAILPDQFAVPVPIWLVTHRELHTARRIRFVYDILSEELSKLTMF